MKTKLLFLFFLLLACFPLWAQQQQQQQPGNQLQQNEQQNANTEEDPNAAPEFNNNQPVAIPAMRNVFFNTLWGSLTGGLLATGLHVLDDSKPSSERFGIAEIGGSFFSGATIGGIVGVVFGLALSFNNVTFYDRDFLMQTNTISSSPYSAPNQFAEDLKYFHTNSPAPSTFYPEQKISLLNIRF